MNRSRSMNASLDNGATDGKYRKVRPDTEVVDGHGDTVTRTQRSTLHPFWNYGPVTQESSTKVNPGRL